MITLGCDVGALFTKLALLDEDALRASRVVRTTGRLDAQLDGLIDELLRDAQVLRNDLRFIGATGSGGDRVRAADFLEDEVTCVGAAVGYYLPDVSLALQIGGQSIAGVELDSDGEVSSFSRNDKCAAGTGRFLEMMSKRLGQSIEAIDALAARAQSPQDISSQCVVFAESEAISQINAGVPVEDIVAGICGSIGRIAAAQGRRATGASRFTVTGGVARFEAVTRVVTERLGLPFTPFPHDPQLAAAMGAALLEETG